MKAALGLLLGLFFAVPAGAEITESQYAEPTDRYAHGVLGDAIEWGALSVTLSDGMEKLFRLPEHLVFEDIEPRLHDVDQDGDQEVIVVLTNADLGAALAIFDETGLIARTEHIGRRNRWLAPIGAADLDGDGLIEIAYIDRPHLAKTLRIWRFENGELHEVASVAGLTNHRIGEDFISGGMRDCGDGPEMITANSNWSRVIATRFDGQNLHQNDAGAFTGRAGMAAVLRCE